MFIATDFHLSFFRASTIPPLSKYFSKLSRKDDTDEDFVISGKISMYD